MDNAEGSEQEVLAAVDTVEEDQDIRDEVQLEDVDSETIADSQVEELSDEVVCNCVHIEVRLLTMEAEETTKVVIRLDHKSNRDTSDLQETKEDVEMVVDETDTTWIASSPLQERKPIVE